MEAANQSEAERKFWKTPELLETLFSLIDLESTLNLARVMDKADLQSGITSKVWDELIRYNCPVDRRGCLFGSFPQDRDSFHKRYHDLKLQEAQQSVKNLATVLKLMGKPKDLLLDLLDLICEGLPPLVGLTVMATNQLQIVCPRHPEPHNVSPAGFLLLEEVESVLGSTEQRIQSMDVGVLFGSIMSAIGSRMTRQQDPVPSIRIRHRITIETEKGASAFHTLMSGQVDHVDTITLEVKGSIGEEGWGAVAKALQLKPDLVDWIWTSKPSLTEGKKDDVKKIWDTVGIQGVELYQTASDVENVGSTWGFSVEKPDDGWERLEQILDMSEAEFAALFEEAQEEDGEEEEGDTETGEEGE